MPELDGKVALITGGSKGIGRAIALRFAEAGADIAVAARGQEDLERTAEDVEKAGRRALPVPTDVSDLGQVAALVKKTVKDLGTIDILVNNAGAAPFRAPVDKIQEAGFEKYFKVSFTSAFYCTKAAAPMLLERKDGSVINIASVAGFTASPGLAYYASAKAALISFTRTVAHEWAPLGVRVNAVAPGWIETEMNEALRQDPDWYEAVRGTIPMARWGKAEEVAEVALFLASDASSYITGSVIVVDGGQTISRLPLP